MPDDSQATPEAPPVDGTFYRSTLGLFSLLSGICGLTLLYFVPVPAANRDAVMLALGVVLGWGSTVVGYEFGSSPTGRKLAEAAVKQVRG